jgi:5-aminopentanamidase
VSKTLLPAHAFHNRCFIAYCNRCGHETVKGEVRAAYLGNSIVVDPLGGVVLAARNEPTLLVADCIPAQFGPSHPEDTRYLGDRRADLYHPLL